MQHSLEVVGQYIEAHFSTHVRQRMPAVTEHSSAPWHKLRVKPWERRDFVPSLTVGTTVGLKSKHVRMLALRWCYLNQRLPSESVLHGRVDVAKRDHIDSCGRQLER